MKHCLIIVFLLLAFDVYGQDIRTTFHTDIGKEVESLDESTFYRNFYLDTVLNSRPIYRLEEYFSSSNSPKRVGYVTNEEEPFRFFYEKSEFYPQGTMRSYEKYNISGAPIDSAFYFYPNSSLKMVTFRNPERDNIVSENSIEYIVYFDSLQNRLLTNGTGFIRLGIAPTLVNGEAYEEANMVDSYREGLWTGRLNNYTIEEQYERGKLIWGKSISPKGKETECSSHIMDVARAKDNGADIRELIPQFFEYPEEALRNRVQGTVSVSFIVDETGDITNIQVLRDIGFGTREAAIRVFRKIGKLQPATNRGVPVRVSYNVPIRLNL